jgi:murein DD-endopeptidase MepM/ murein hydrolase activator NlpD
MTRLPILKGGILRLEHSKQDGIPTGGAADINKVPDATEDKLQEETPKLLYGGIRYCHYTNNAEELQDNDNTCNSLNKDDTDFYAEEKEEENEGYTGDSMELAAEYKRKHDEEQEKKAEELARQQAAKQSQQIQKTKQNPQSPSANWIMPVTKGHKITSGYGYRIHPVYHTRNFHDGIDINATMNTPVYAVAGGTVFKSEWYNGYGNYIEIDHGNGIHSFYGHLNKLLVYKGHSIKQGQLIGLSGNTGVGTAAHLHFGVHKNYNSDNPINYLPKF